MNEVLRNAITEINKHGNDITYKQVQEGTYDYDTGNVTNTEVTYTVKAYKKHIQANQYSFPNLIGKDAAMFYIANYNLAFVPEAKDLIEDSDSDKYTVDSIKEHRAFGMVILYKVVAVRG